MKHIFSFLFMIVLLAFSFSFSDTQNNKFDFFYDGDCEIVVGAGADLSFLQGQETTLNSGGDVIVKAKASLFNYVVQRVGKENVKGYVFKVSNSFENLKNSFNLKYFSDKKVDNAKHFYAFSNQFDSFVFVSGKKVNMHIVEKDNMLVVGFPIILTSY